MELSTAELLSLLDPLSERFAKERRRWEEFLLKIGIGGASSYRPPPRCIVIDAAIAAKIRGADTAETEEEYTDAEGKKATRVKVESNVVFFLHEVIFENAPLYVLFTRHDWDESLYRIRYTDIATKEWFLKSQELKIAAQREAADAELAANAEHYWLESMMDCLVNHGWTKTNARILIVGSWTDCKKDLIKFSRCMNEVGSMLHFRFYRPPPKSLPYANTGTESSTTNTQEGTQPPPWASKTGSDQSSGGEGETPIYLW